MRRIRICAAALAAFLASAAASAADVAVRDGWARVDPGRRGGAVLVYFTLENRGGMAMLVGAETDLGGVAAIRSDTDGRPGGATRIVDRMMIGPGAKIAFAPGEYAVAVTELPALPREGDSFSLRLTFADSAAAEAMIAVGGDGA